MLLGAIAAISVIAGMGTGQPRVAAAVAPVGAGFNLNPSDLRFILKQIKIAERHAATRTADNPCGTLVGPNENQIPDGSPQTRELPFGLRTVDGSCNNIVPGRERFAKADELFPRMIPKRFRAAENGTTYESTGGTVIDSQPRTVSNLVVDQTAGNPAAVEAAGPTPIVTPSGAFHIPNVAPDVGLSAPFNVWFVFFGQFFDHGLDLVQKGGNGTVFMPLKPDDPLFNPGPDNIPNTADDGPNFMLLTRATQHGDHENLNKTNPLVDQQQTYASHPSHQVFLRQYEMNGVGRPVSTGRLLTGPGDGMSMWATLKAQALTLLGIELRDTDVFAVPTLATDPYGKFIPGPNGFAQMVKVIGGVETLVEGNPAAPINTDNAVLTNHSFLDDIAHHAVPGLVEGSTTQQKVPDADPGTTDDHDPTTYDDEMLNAHFMAGDGRVNENIALTSVHHVFHAEHNRLTGHIKDVLTNQDPTQLPEWQLSPGVWNGERIFQAARFVTEMEYQHLVFEEFARKIQPMINAFGEGGSGFHPEINPSVRAEFAHAAFRVGHTMLVESIDRVRPDGTVDNIPLLDAFLNPPALLAGGLTADQGVGSIVRGTTRQTGNDIDELVTEAVRNRLLGLPLDLPAINMARGRDTGLPRLNEARRMFYAQTQNSALVPYESWADYRFSLKHPFALANFIAAYGTHPSITGATTLAAKRAAAELIVAADPANPNTPPDAVDFLNSNNAWANNPDGSTTTGLDDVDLWVGGIAEKQAVFGGFLGSTLNHIFELQLEDLQNGDRFYYLSRTAGLNILTQLEGNSFAELVMRNSDAQGLPADVFSRPDFVFAVANLGTTGPVPDDPATPDVDESAVLTRMGNGTIRFGGPEHVVWNGTPNNDRIWSSEGDDTIRGDDGNDWMQGGDGNDNLVGGLGDDIMLDLAGDDTLKGGDGNDVLSSGQGFGGDLNQGGRGSDFIMGGNDVTETFGGPGNDFVFAGDSEDTVFGDDGDDWEEAGGGPFNLLQGDNGAPFQDDPNEAGHDVLMGTGGEQDFDSEGGDDIMFLGAGIQRAEGMLGFDWATHKLDPLPGDSDMTFGLAALPAVDVNRDRFDRVEALSGWRLNDILRGDNRSAVVDVELGLLPGHVLTPAGVDRIAGLQDVLGNLNRDALGNRIPFAGGNIILGGAGSDLIEGRGGDDILDGDRWLDAQISVRDRLDPTVELRRVDTMAPIRADVTAGLINPSQLQIVRTIRTEAPGTDIDTALFSGPRAEYDITVNADGSLTVAHARGPRAPNDNTDTLRNFEQLRFADVTIPAPAVSDLSPAVTLSTTTLTFPDTAVGATSAAQTFTVTNSGTAPLDITRVISEEVVGDDPALALDFAAGGTCTPPVTISPGGTCTVEVTFTPGATGPRRAEIQVESNAAGSPHIVAVSGNGIVAPAPVATLGATSSTFGNQIVGTTSAPDTITLSNTGNAPLGITGIALGGANPGDFTRGGTCNAPSSVSAGGSCTITLSFSPSATGPRSAELSITTNAAGSPHTISVSGNGTAPPPTVLLGAEVTEPATDSNPAGSAEAFRVTASTTGSLSTLRVFVDATSAATNMIAGIYSNTATNHPGVLLARGSLASPTAGQWNNVPLANGVSVTAGTVYWIALLGPTGAGELRFRDRCCGGANQPAESSSQTNLTNLPGTWTTGQSFRDGPVSAVGLSGITPVDNQLPTVSVSSPTAGANVSGTVNVNATAGDNVAVAGVQFFVDGTALGAEDTTAPYSRPWNTTTAANGGHQLTARARDGAGNTRTSVIVNVTVNNATAPPPPPPPPPSGTTLLGNQTVEPSVDFNPAGMAEAFRATASASGTVTALRVYVDATSTATTLVAGLYSDAGGQPGTLLAQGTLSTITNGALNTVSVPGTAVTAGTTYWIAILGPAGGGTLRFRDRCCGGGQPAETSSQTNLTTLPATWSRGTVFSDGPATAFGIG